MFREAFGAQLQGAPTRWIEPPWKAILSNKGILPLLWEMFPGHPNLLPAFFEDDPRAAELGSPMCASRSIRAKAPTSRWSPAACARSSTQALRRRRFHPAGAGAAAEFFRPLSGAGQLAGGRRALRAVDPRRREPDHRQHIAFLPHAISVRRALLPFSPCGRRCAKRRMRGAPREFKCQLGSRLTHRQRPGAAAAWHKLHRDFSQRQTSYVLKGRTKILRRPEYRGTLFATERGTGAGARAYR